MENLIGYINSYVPLSAVEIDKLKLAFKPYRLKRKENLLQEGQICQFIAFVRSGIIRHYHLKNGNEITCDFTISNNFLTDFRSLIYNQPSSIYLQAIEPTELFLVSKENLEQLYATSKNIESFGRIMAEQVAIRTIEMSVAIASQKPIQRYEKLIKERNELVQKVPQKYLASLIGITPESLSRIRSKQKS